MSEYVEREVLIDAIESINWYKLIDDVYSTIEETIKTVPAADVRAVVRGKWENAIQSCGDSPHIKCSVCGTYFWQYFRQFNWCPICGAKMGGADNA